MRRWPSATPPRPTPPPPPGLTERARLPVALRPDLTVSRRARSLESRGADVAGLHRAIGPGAAALLSRWLAEGSARLSVVLPPAERRRPASARRVRLRVHPALWSPSPNGRRDVLLLGGEREGTYVAAIGDTVRRGRQVLALFASGVAGGRVGGRGGGGGGAGRGSPGRARRSSPRSTGWVWCWWMRKATSGTGSSASPATTSATSRGSARKGRGRHCSWRTMCSRRRRTRWPAAPASGSWSRLRVCPAVPAVRGPVSL